MKAVHVVISGIVQGVGFRAFVYQQAQRYQLTGWVRNTETNKVEAVFCGEEDAIENIIKDCKQGPYASEVHDILVEDFKLEKKFSEFSVY